MIVSSPFEQSNAFYALPDMHSWANFLQLSQHSWVVPSDGTTPPKWMQVAVPAADLRRSGQLD